MDRLTSDVGEPGAGLRGGLVVTTLAACGTVVSLQQTLILPVLPDFPRILHTGADNASWLVTATLLVGAVATPTISRLADMFGKKRMMMVTLAIMVTGSILGAFASTLPAVLAARALQGVGLAMLPVGIAIMRDVLPRERVPLGVALMSGTLAIGAGTGLPLAGFIINHVDWHAIFWITGITGTVLLVAVAAVVSESPVRSRGAFDYTGALLLSLALASILLALSKGGSWGWTSPTTIGLGLLGAAMLMLWLPLELRVTNPLVDLRVAARPAVLLVNLAAVLSGFAMFANMLVTTQLLQAPTDSGYGMGMDILHTGLWMAPSALVFGAMAPFSAALIRRFGPPLTLLVGALWMAVSYASRVYFSDLLWQIVAGSVLVSIGTSLMYAVMPTLIMRAVPVTETASANGLNTLLRSVGTSMSSATMAAVATIGVIHIGGRTVPSFAALTGVFWLSGALSLLAGLLSLPLLRMRSTEDPQITALPPQPAQPQASRPSAGQPSAGYPKPADPRNVQTKPAQVTPVQQTTEPPAAVVPALGPPAAVVPALGTIGD